jgi:hypothetical protein
MELLDAVAPRIPVDQLAFDVAQRVSVFVNGEEDGDGHSHEMTLLRAA